MNRKQQKELMWTTMNEHATDPGEDCGQLDFLDVEPKAEEGRSEGEENDLICGALAAESVDYAAPGGVIAADLDSDPVSDQHPHHLGAHLARNVAQDDLAIVQAHTEHAVGEQFCDQPFRDQLILLLRVGRLSACRHLKRGPSRRRGGRDARTR